MIEETIDSVKTARRLYVSSQFPENELIPFLEAQFTVFLKKSIERLINDKACWERALNMGLDVVVFDVRLSLDCRADPIPISRVSD